MSGRPQSPISVRGDDQPSQLSSTRVPVSSAAGEHRAQLRLRSLSWALQAAVVAGLVTLAPVVLPALRAELGPQAFTPVLAAGLEAALRSAGCGFFYGLLAFHLQRVDPDDTHLQAGLVGAICGLRSLGAPLGMATLGSALSRGPLAESLPSAMMLAIKGWLPLWLPLIGSALILHGALRLLPVLRP